MRRMRIMLKIPKLTKTDCAYIAGVAAVTLINTAVNAVKKLVVVRESNFVGVGHPYDARNTYKEEPKDAE